MLTFSLTLASVNVALAGRSFYDDRSCGFHSHHKFEYPVVSPKI